MYPHLDTKAKKKRGIVDFEQLRGYTVIRSFGKYSMSFYYTAGSMLGKHVKHGFSPLGAHVPQKEVMLMIL